MIYTIDETESVRVRKRALFTPHHIILIAMWFIATVSLIYMLGNGVRSIKRFYSERNFLHIGYTMVLFWYLIRTDSSVKHLPEVSPILLPKRKIGKLIPVIIIALLLVSEFYNQGIVLPLLILSTIWILIIWRREINLSNIIVGFVVTIIALLGGLPMYQNHLVNLQTFFGLLAFTMPMFVASSLLFKHTGLGGSQLFLMQYGKAVKSFLWGCLLFIPFGLINAAAGFSGHIMGRHIIWVTNWWQPFSLTFFSAITEEAWFRLFMVPLCYFLLRPAFTRVPALSIVLSTLFSAIVFGMGHGGDLMHGILNIGLLYGLPMAILYVRRDWEYAVGAHYMIDLIPWIMVFLESRGSLF